MKTITAVLTALLLSTAALNPETTEVSQNTSLDLITEADGGGHRFGGRKEQNRKNRNSRRIQRRNGIGQIETPSWEWTLIDVQLKKPLLAYELRKEVILG